MRNYHSLVAVARGFTGEKKRRTRDVRRTCKHSRGNIVGHSMSMERCRC